MLRVALAQVRLNARRFIAVSLAVIIAVVFLTATLIINSSSKASLAQSVGHGFRHADLVLSPDDPYGQNGEPDILDQTAVDAVADAEGVAGTYALRSAYAVFGEGRNRNYGQVRSLPESAPLLPVDLVEGNLPAAEAEVLLDEVTAERLELEPGAVLPLETQPEPESDTEADAGLPPLTELTVTGLVTASDDPTLMGGAQLYAADATVARLGEPEQGFTNLQIALTDDADTAAAAAALQQALTDAGVAGVTVRTAAEEVDRTMAGFTGGEDQLTVILLAFAAVALLVCALVVSNTFSVLVAQRTRELALLRCIGAGRAQIRRSVIVEALVVGVVSSVIGVLLAVGLMAGIIAYLQTVPEAGFATLAVGPGAVAAGLAAGILLTVLAALVPARAATAVAPLAALRPAEDLRVGSRRGRIRLGIGLVFLAGGALLLGVGAVMANLLIALPGGILSFIGVLMCATLFVPPLVRAVGALAAPLGVPGKLAAVNAVRNPQRTSATSSALLIGVTLVAMMMSGAAMARTAFNDTLAQEFPVDVSVEQGMDSGEPYTDADVQKVLALDGVDQAVLLAPGGAVDVDGSDWTVYVLDPADGSVLQDQGLVPADGTISMPQGTKAKTVTVRGAVAQVELDVVVSGNPYFDPLISPATAEQIGGALAPVIGEPAAQPQLWLGVEDGLGTNQLMDLRSELSAVLDVEDYYIDGSAIQRAAFEQVINVLLLVVTGLLGVAVVIALVGVANTLSLSVLERTRESSLLRALGLTRAQLRGMLALEAVLIAGVAALLGCVLGVVYGWLGAQSALGAFAAVVPVVPWLQLIAVLSVALVAGLLASVLPARRAARLSPVEGLAAD
ncbi:ABC transporter permease YtrF precursor [Arthrobacter saudimassiliensis]|uniref:ABC transporter permease YtrF n=1 Tax=Arthrobacter saudimassiliensis TaxID=1461584 RepID=A0A078MQC0_9MICC|nr:ABC transporter permease YtrF precursor [Arthrobacter saudimassiliensis]